jgi:hypothetical protein
VVVEVKHQVVSTVQQAVVARAVVLDGRTILRSLQETQFQDLLEVVVLFQHLLGQLQQLMAVTVGLYQPLRFLAVGAKVELQTVVVPQLVVRL